MHENEVPISHEQVVALIADELPALAGCAIVPVEGGGTVNTIYRIGSAVTARFPLRHDDPDRMLARLRKEMSASAEFVLASPVPAPEPLHIGSPGHSYPMPWTTQSWLPGSTATPTSCDRAVGLARDLCDVVSHLRAWNSRGRSFRGAGRGGVLADHDGWIDECITHSEGLVDTGAMRSLWSKFRQLPREDPDVMCHTDLIPSNVLVADGRLSGLLDTGGFQAADPALDLVVAWHLFTAEVREQVRGDLGCSDLQWERGKAWAFQQAAGAYWYYQHSNPSMADMGKTTLERLLRAEA